MDLVELCGIPPKTSFFMFRFLSRRKGEILCSFACNPVCSLAGTCRVFNLARSSCSAAQTSWPFCVLGRINASCEYRYRVCVANARTHHSPDVFPATQQSDIQSLHH